MNTILSTPLGQLNTVYLPGSVLILAGGAFLLYDRCLAHRRAGRCLVFLQRDEK